MNILCKKCLFVLLSLLVLPLVYAEEAQEDDPAMEFFKGEADVVYPSPAPLLVNGKNRNYQSLNGKWAYVVDEPGTSWNYITGGRYIDDESIYPKTGMSLVETSFDKRRTLMVPGDWNSQVPQLDRYRSRVVYYKAIEMSPEEGKRYFFHIGGANYTTDLFVNNKLVGRHVGGYTAFNFDVTNFVTSGKNTFIVRVNAHLDESTIPTMSTSDFWKYGGITRDVGLITLPDTYLSQYHLYLHDLAAGEIRGWVQLAGEAPAGKALQLEIPQAGVQIPVTTGEDGRGDFSVKVADLKLWSPDSPTLYDVSLTLGEDSVNDRIGFRTIQTEGTNILLNGEPVKLRGISMHDESVLHAGMAHSEEDARASLELVKELNANYVRLAHYPHNEYTVRLADEMGLMLWSEVPIVSLIDWDNEETLAMAKGQVIDNVSRDINRASIIFWSVSNESFPATQDRLDFLGELAATARGLDESNRPIASALVGNPNKEFADLGGYLVKAILANPDADDTVKQRLIGMMKAVGQAQAQGEQHSTDDDEVMHVMISDPLGEVVDVVGYNEYFGWYYSGFFAQTLGIDEGLVRDAMLSIMPRMRFDNSFGKPMIISEFGAGAKQGLRSKEGLIWSEEYQARVYRAQLEMLDKSPSIQGYSPWLLKDFRSHIREFNGIQDTYNRKGLVSETGKKKLAFHVLSEHYGQQKSAIGK